jgi:UPF0271 protein
VSHPIEPFGDAALRVALPDGVDARALLAGLRATPGVIDAVVAERHAVVTFDPARPPPDIDAVVDAAAIGTGREGAHRHVIAVRYDGCDLREVATSVGMDPRELAELHSAPEYLVVAVGFLPGFAYLRGLDARLIVPRRASPRTRVAPGSVAIGGPYTGVYPFASPGGWNVVGTAVGFAPFDAERGAKLALGDAVRFVEVRDD